MRIRVAVSALPGAVVEWSVAILPAAVILTVACAGTRVSPDDRPLRAPGDVPDRFLVGDPSREATLDPAPGMDCRNPMVDPRTGHRIRLVRSSEGRGDYEVPPGLYGVGEDEVLRIDCATGRAIGVFGRQKGD